MDKYVLKMRQAMPLEDKIAFTTRRIHEWVDAFGLGYIYRSVVERTAQCCYT